MDEFFDLSKFKKLDEIGHGAFGRVFRVLEKGTEDVFAAKISFTQINENDKKIFMNLRREVNILSKLNHPSVLRFIGYSPFDFNEKPYPVIVTEYSPNGTLEDIIKLERKSIPPQMWSDTKKIINIYGIASAMKYLHSHKILHRDLKPANILEDDNLFPKIADFGLSKICHSNIESMTSQSTIGFKGTPIYTAPEIWLENEYTKSGDVYSFSIIFYELFSVNEPFKNYDLETLYTRVIMRGERPKFENEIPECYQELIQQCWSPNPDERPTFDEIVLQLKTNDDFILDSIDKDEYFEYVDLIDDMLNSFDSKSVSNEVKTDDNHEKNSENSNENGEKISEDNNHICSGKMNQKIDEENNDKYLGDKSENKFDDNDDEKRQKIDEENDIVYSEERGQKIDEENDIVYSEEKSQKVDEENSDINSKENKNDLKQSSGQIVEQKITVGDFNHLTLKSQQLVISDLIESKPKYKESKVLLSVDNILKYFIENGGKTEERYLSIPTKKESSQIEVFLMQKSKISISYEGIEIINEHSITDFFEYIKDINRALIEIRYPTTIFSTIYEKLLKYKEQYEEKILIKLLINGIDKTDMTFRNDKNIKSIIIGKDIEEISGGEIGFRNSGGGSFYGCSSIKSISFEYPSSLKSIGNYSFCGCSSIMKITFPSSLEIIEVGSFSGCTSLVEILIPSSVTSIKSYAFFGCYTLNQITFSTPSSVAEIEEYAFSGCISLKKISLPSSLKKLKNYAFSECSSLTEISIPSSVTEIGEYIFNKCKTIILSNNMKSIPPNSFNGCFLLTKITIPSSVTSIGKNAFKNCTSITNISIPSSVTSIDEFAFENCTSLTNISISSPIKSISKGTFLGCSSLEQISVPSSVEKINNLAFKGCSSLREILVPHGTTIGKDVFNGCSSLMGFSITSKYGCKIDKGVFNLCISLTEISFPSDLSEICERAFCNCTSLKEVTFNSDNELTEIGIYAFYGCSSLIQMTIPSSVTTIGKNAFEGCSSLEKVQIPSSLYSIEDHVFDKCSSLKEVIIPASVSKIGNYSFFGCSSLKYISYNNLFKSKLASIGESAFENCSSLIKFPILSSVNEIGNYAFLECSSLQNIFIPSSVKKMGNSVFGGCSSLTEISFKTDSSLSSIERYSFIGCSSLTKIEIPSSVTEIGDSAFRDCTSLVQVSFEQPSSVSKIGKSSFIGCSSLAQIEVPSSVTEIGDCAFYECSSLIPPTNLSSCTSIGKHAFEGCCSTSKTSSIQENQESISIQNESNLTQDESNSTQNESNSAQNESNSTQNESNSAQNETNLTQNESKLIQVESNLAQNKTNPTQNEPNSIKNESNSTQDEPNSTQNENNSTQNESNLVQDEPNSTQYESKLTQNETNPSQSESNSIQDESASMTNVQTRSIPAFELSPEKDQIIDQLISSHSAQDLIQYLHNSCDNDTISNVYEKCRHTSHEFYTELIQEGLLINDSVSHYKYATLCIIESSKSDTTKEMTNKQNEAVKHLKESIKNGYMYANLLLSLVYKQMNENDKAFNCLLSGSNEGEKNCKCLIGYFIAHGIGTKRDFMKGVSIILSNKVANYHEKFASDIGLYYTKLNENGEINSETNEKTAFKYFEIAFNRRKTKATINNLGVCYLIGYGIEKDIEKAKEIFNLGVSQNDANSMYHIGFIYEEEDPIKSLQFYKKAAELGHAYSQAKHAFNIEKIEMNSQESNAILLDENDKNSSIELHKKAANGGCSISQEFLAKKFSNENDTECFDMYCKMLIKKGNTNVPLEFAANLYKNKKYNQAFHYFSLLDEINHPIARYFIGVMNFYGQGCAENKEKSFKIMNELSKQGIEKATNFIEDHFEDSL